MEILILLLVLVLGLIMIPFGLPGTWIIAGGALGYSLLVPGSISIVTVVLVAVLALLGELIQTRDRVEHDLSRALAGDQRQSLVGDGNARLRRHDVVARAAHTVNGGPEGPPYISKTFRSAGYFAAINPSR